MNVTDDDEQMEVSIKCYVHLSFWKTVLLRIKCNIHKQRVFYKMKRGRKKKKVLFNVMNLHKFWPKKGGVTSYGIFMFYHKFLNFHRNVLYVFLTAEKLVVWT